MQDGARNRNISIRTPCSLFYRHVILPFPQAVRVLEPPTYQRASIGKKEREKVLSFHHIPNDAIIQLSLPTLRRLGHLGRKGGNEVMHLQIEVSHASAMS